MARRLMRLASAIVVPSDYLVDVFARFGLPPRAFTMSPKPIRFPIAIGRGPGPVFLHNRGLAPEYNPACTLRAFAIIQQRYPEARLTIAHDGPLRPQLEALARSLGSAPNTIHRFCFARHMAALYDSADIYLMSPNADNMPLSLLECFAAGLPVVSSNAGGIPNIVEDQQTGLLFAPNDHQAMAACALRLLEEPGLASRLARNARAQCDKYSWTRDRTAMDGALSRLLDVRDQFRVDLLPSAAPKRRSKTARRRNGLCTANCLAQHPEFHQCLQNIAQLIDVARLEQHPVLAVANQFQISADSGSHRTAAAGHGFEQRIRQRFRARRQNKNIDRPQPLGHIRSGRNENAIAAPGRAPGPANAARSSMEPLPTISSFNPGRFNTGECLDQGSQILLRPQRADDADGKRIAWSFPRLKLFQIHAVVAKPDPIGGHVFIDSAGAAGQIRNSPRSRPPSDRSLEPSADICRGINERCDRWLDTTTARVNQRATGTANSVSG